MRSELGFRLGFWFALQLNANGNSDLSGHLVTAWRVQGINRKVTSMPNGHGCFR
jgi:hypothetical protein